MPRSRQRRPTQLMLRASGRRGGYRAGAGRPRGRSPHYIPHIPRPSVSRHHPVHVTMRLVENAPDLCESEAALLVEEVFQVERDKKGFRLVHYSIRPNHLHLLCEATGKRALSRGIQRITAWIVRKVNRVFRRRGRLFADRFHGHVLQKPTEVRHALRYVLLNAHKDLARTRTRLIGLDAYSSGKYFDGWADVKAKPPPWREATVVRPGTWLLLQGWRKAGGLIRTDELSDLPSLR